MQTQAEIGALVGQLAVVDDDFCEFLLATIARLSTEKPECFLPEDVVNAAKWIRFIRCLRKSLETR